MKSGDYRNNRGSEGELHICVLKAKPDRLTTEHRCGQSHTSRDTDVGVHGSTRMKRSSNKHPWLSFWTPEGLQSGNSGKAETDQLS